MAARPNTLRTLEYGKRLVDNQLQRLQEMIANAEKVIAENRTLTPEDIASYKACISLGKKQITLFEKLAAFELPDAPSAPPRKRGRPSKAELEALAADRGEKPAAPKAKAKPAKIAASAEAPKRRGRPPKAKLDAAPVAADAPKRRGRPPKVKSDDADAVEAKVAAPAPKRRGRPPKVKTDEVVEAAPKRRGRPPKATTEQTTETAPQPKRRGRPPKAETADKRPDAPVKRRGRPPKAAAGSTEQVETVVEQPTKRGPGRPKGSKNKVLNGKNAEVIAA